MCINPLCQEEGVSAVFVKYGLTYNVPISTENVGNIENFPWLRPSDFLTHMATTHQLHRLLGGMNLKEAKPTLELFWSRYQTNFPQHAVFQDPVKSQNLHNCLPIMIHGDEGTGFKKKGVLIIALQSIIGHGARHSPNQIPGRNGVTEAGIPMNFLQTALANRFLSCICPKDCMAKKHVFFSFQSSYGLRGWLIIINYPCREGALRREGQNNLQGNSAFACKGLGEVGAWRVLCGHYPGVPDSSWAQGWLVLPRNLNLWELLCLNFSCNILFQVFCNIYMWAFFHTRFHALTHTYT